MTDRKEVFDLLDDYYARRMTAGNIPGMALAVTDRDRTVHRREMGVADIASGREVTDETLFQIGSISKSFTSVALLRLVEQGKVDLHAPVKEYLPWFEIRSRYAPITLHHLLTHTAGITMGSDSTVSALSEVWCLRDMDVSAPPGEYFSYSNTGYKAAGLVLEAVTGVTCADAVKRAVVDPLGMKRTHTSIANGLRESTAVGYGWLHDDKLAGRKSPLAPAIWSESTSADGSISSVAEDMSAYVRMLLRRGEGPDRRIISEKSFDLLTGRHITPLDSYHGESYGYGLNVEDSDGHRLIWHTGGMVGYTSAMHLDMNLGMGIIVLTNSLSGPDEISRHSVRTLRAAAEGNALPEMSVPPHAFMPEEPERYVGTYACAHREVTISVEGKALMAEIDGQRLELEGLSQECFLLDHPLFDLYALRFIVLNGAVKGFAHGPDIYDLEPNSEDTPAPAPPEHWNAYVGHYRSHNPWQPNIRVVMRRGQLVFIDSAAGEEPMHPLSDGSFRIGNDPRSPERISFDMVIDGKAVRASVAGGFLHRSFRP